MCKKASIRKWVVVSISVYTGGSQHFSAMDLFDLAKNFGPLRSIQYLLLYNSGFYNNDTKNEFKNYTTNGYSYYCAIMLQLFMLSYLLKKPSVDPRLETTALNLLEQLC